MFFFKFHNTLKYEYQTMLMQLVVYRPGAIYDQHPYKYDVDLTGAQSFNVYIYIYIRAMVNARQLATYVQYPVHK